MKEDNVFSDIPAVPNTIAVTDMRSVLNAVAFEDKDVLKKAPEVANKQLPLTNIPLLIHANDPVNYPFSANDSVADSESVIDTSFFFVPHSKRIQTPFRPLKN